MSTTPRLRDNNPCHICGQTEFEWGFVRDRGAVTYLKGENGFLRGFEGGTELTARRCLECGCVQLFHPKSRS